MLHAGSWQGSINLVASTSFKPQQQRFSIPAIKNASSLRAPDFKRKTAKILQSPKPLKTSQSIRLAEIYKTQIQRDAPQPAGFDVADTQNLLLWGKLWNSWHNNTVKNAPWKGGPLQKGLTAFTFPFLCSVLCPGGSWTVGVLLLEPTNWIQPLRNLHTFLLSPWQPPSLMKWEPVWWRTHFKRICFSNTFTKMKNRPTF